MSSSALRKETALVVLSGGQDSTTCLYWALQEFGKVVTVSFDYGQRHAVELESARRVAELAGVGHRIVPVNALADLGGSGLTDRARTVDEVGEDGLPTSFVPGRNVILLTLAAAYAYQHGVRHLVTGVCQTDYSGYPDCRDETIASLEATLTLALGRAVYVHTPLMWLSKAESVKLAQDVGAMEALAYSHTCYQGLNPPCGTCPACVIRARGFEEAGVADPLLEAAST